MAGDDPVRDGKTERERESCRKGYNDYGIPGFIKPVYAPPAGYEKDYKEGWNTRRLEEDEHQLREWTRLP